MPRISTATLAQHREWRRQQLVSAAMHIALHNGGAAVTVAAVAERAGLSRTSVYEYFGSSAELVADLVIEELRQFSTTLQEAISLASKPEEAIALWIDAALRYIADGRHLLAKALSSTATPTMRAQEIGTEHRALLTPLRNALVELGVKDVSQSLLFIQSITDASTKRIENGNEAEIEINSATHFCLAGILSLVN